MGVLVGLVYEVEWLLLAAVEVKELYFRAKHQPRPRLRLPLAPARKRERLTGEKSKWCFTEAGGM